MSPTLGWGTHHTLLPTTAMTPEALSNPPQASDPLACCLLQTLHKCLPEGSGGGGNGTPRQGGLGVGAAKGWPMIQPGQVDARRQRRGTRRGTVEET